MDTLLEEEREEGKAEDTCPDAVSITEIYNAITFKQVQRTTFIMKSIRKKDLLHKNLVQNIFFHIIGTFG